jgi:L-seryl-tRNA(Ser) seleniumtransferase
MNRPADPAAKMQKQPGATLRAIPSIDELLNRPRLAGLAEKAGRALVTRVARTAVADLRARMKDAPSTDANVSSRARSDDNVFEPAALEERIISGVEEALAPSLRRVINATGVVLHTNLGRAPISEAAAAAIARTAMRYSNLEYDIETGERGKRDVHTGRLLAQLVGAEAAIVVNNNAAAVFLVLNTMAKGAEVIVSRGELIEIGDGFRIPDIMAESGAMLREVGTTNRTHIRDYERAINERTRLLLRVHPSNFRITGFTERPSLEDLAGLGQRFQIPVFEDLGSGCLADLTTSGVSEPVARASFDAGAGIVSFSGDKLLGGPQSGIIAGKRDLIEKIRRNPLFRALRVDKLTIAALEVTLNAYIRGALDEVPALRMIRMTAEELHERTTKFAEQLGKSMQEGVSAGLRVEVREGFSVIGGGSTPDQQLATWVLAITSRGHSAAELEERLRKAKSGIPVIARIEDDFLILDLRTVLPDEEPLLSSTLVEALG